MKLAWTLDMINSFSALFMNVFSFPPKSCAMLTGNSSVAQYFDGEENAHSL